jgi:hypothetical protein
MSNLQGSQEEYVDYCNIPLPPKQKYASFDAPVNDINKNAKAKRFILGC